MVRNGNLFRGFMAALCFAMTVLSIAIGSSGWAVIWSLQVGYWSARIYQEERRSQDMRALQIAAVLRALGKRR